MSCPADLRIVVASDGRALSPAVQHAVAQLSAACQVDLAIAHVELDEGAPAVLSPLHFEPEAAPRRVQRLTLEGRDVATAIAALSSRHPFDLVMAPASPGPAWLRLGRASVRTRLLARSGVPLWTAGRGLAATHFQRPLRTVACLLDFDADPAPLLHRAGAFARRMQARLHVLATLPPADDSTLATVLTSDTPLLPAAAVARIEALCAGRLRPVVDVVVDGQRRGLTRLVRSCRPDVIFVDATPWATPWPFGFSRTLDALGCAVVCVPGGAGARAWSFERVPMSVPATAMPGRPAVAGGGPIEPWPAEGMASRAL